MRILIAIPALVALGACNVSKDGNAVTVQYDQNTAENVVSDVGNTAEGLGGAIANEAQETANKVDNSGIVADDDNNSADGNTTNQQ
jgi:hypothetical protein